MPRLIMMRGLPGSGKSTQAKHMLEENPGHTIRLNRDLLREMLHYGRYSKTNESHIISAECNLAAYFLSLGLDVIIDDTNLKPATVTMWEDLANNVGVSIIIHTVDTPIETCIERDAGRTKPVGEARIREMAGDL